MWDFKHDNGSTVKIMPNHIYTKLSDDFGGNNLRKSTMILTVFNKSETKLLENFAEVSEILEIGRNTIENLRSLKENIYMQF